MERRTERPVLGVVPYFHDIWIEEEDALPSRAVIEPEGRIRISVVKLPHMSNFTDFDPLQKEPGVVLEYVGHPHALEASELIILPGTKNTIADLTYLRQSGLAEAIVRAAHSNVPVIGICGGYQMLGQSITDAGFESSQTTVEGLGLLDMKTTFCGDKITARVKARPLGAVDLICSSASEITGYEIHMGQSHLEVGSRPAFEIITRNNNRMSTKDGAVSQDGLVLGTYLHGLFDNASVREDLLKYLRDKTCKNGPSQEREPLCGQDIDSLRETELDRLADLVRSNLDMDAFFAIAGRS